MPGRIETNLAELCIQLPVPTPAVANYLPFTYSAGQLYISGQLPKGADDKFILGQLGTDLPLEEGKNAAYLCGINVIAQIRAAIGDLDRVKKIVKITCFVNSSNTFTQHPVVANSCSDLFVKVFGDKVGRHARCAMGVAQLPFGAAVEVEAIVEIEGQPLSQE